MVIIVDHYEVAQLQVTCNTCSLARDALHSATISEEAECVVVDDLKAGLVEVGTSLCLGNGQTNGVGETLTKRASSDLNTWCILAFRVAWGDAVDLL